MDKFNLMLLIGEYGKECHKRGVFVHDTDTKNYELACKKEQELYAQIKNALFEEGA